MSTQTLAAATHDRKARLAQLKNLKRKHPEPDVDYTKQEVPRPAKILRSPRPENGDDEVLALPEDLPESTEIVQVHEAPDVTRLYLSGRNYDTVTGDVKLGFEHNPDNGQVTLESQADSLVANAKAEAVQEEAENRPLDLFSLQPKKPNWDLKRDLAAKLKILDIQTENAVAKLVRERIDSQKRTAIEQKRGSKTLGHEGEEEEEVGMAGPDLLEAMHLREQGMAAEARRERQADEDEDLT